MDETCFYFDDDIEEGEHYLGYLPKCEKSYWVGYCDIEGGTDFHSAAELVEAPIYHGKSLKERWNHVIIISIEGMCFEDWEKYCLRKEPVPSLPRNGKILSKITGAFFMMATAATVGLILGAAFHNCVGGTVLTVLISGIACLIYMISAFEKK